MKCKTVCLALLPLAFAACNGGVFVDDYMPHGAVCIQMSDPDRVEKIAFASGNWGIDYIEGWANSVEAYTLDGKPAYLPFAEGELGVLHCKSDYADIRIEKSGAKELKVSYAENLLDDVLELVIKVGNRYKQEDVRLNLAPTPKYQVDSIVYDWQAFEFYGQNTIEEMETIEVDNSASDRPTSITVYPFRRTKQREIYLFPERYSGNWDEEKFGRCFGTHPSPRMTIPDVVDGKPVLADTKIPFDNGHQYIDINADRNLAVTVTIDAHDRRRVLVYNYVQQYGVPFKIYASGPKKDEKYQFDGYLSSDGYDCTDYLIFKQKIAKSKM